MKKKLQNMMDEKKKKVRMKKKGKKDMKKKKIDSGISGSRFAAIYKKQNIKPTVS